MTGDLDDEEHQSTDKATISRKRILPVKGEGDHLEEAVLLAMRIEPDEDSTLSQ